MKELKYLNRFFKKYKWLLVFGLFITIVSQVFLVLVPGFVKDAVNIIATSTSESKPLADAFKGDLGLVIMKLVGATLLGAGFTFIMRQTIIVMSRHIEYDLKNVIFKQYQQLSLNFYKKNRTGDLMNRISEDVTKVRMYLGPSIMYTSRSIVMITLVATLMFIKLPQVAGWILLPLPILTVLVYKVSVLVHRRTTIVQEYLSKLSTFTQESFSGISVLKAYNLEPQTVQDFNTLATDSKDKNLDLVKIQAVFFPLMILLIGCSNVLVFYLAGDLAIAGKTDTGTVVAFLFYVNMLTWPVTSIGWITNIVKQAEASQARINQFLKIKPEISNEGTHMAPIIGNIAFNNVSFTYDDTNITALKNISFKVKAGETIAILGKTGSGKSTLLELIGRLYDVENGNITIDEATVKDHDLENLRSSIGYVPQDAFLFSESIADNIRFGFPTATQQEIEQAAINADVHDNIVEFNKGYETVLGERGITLSGGQKQRVSIARAIIKKPTILLFDDCLSAVDTDTEEAILSNLKTLSQQITTFIVTHRVSSAIHADKIIVLDDGKIIQEDNHASLLESDGYYKELYNKQLSENG